MVSYWQCDSCVHMASDYPYDAGKVIKKLHVLTLKEVEFLEFKGSSNQFTCCIAGTVIRIAPSWLPADVCVR